MTTGEKLAVLRKKMNLTQEQLAEILSVSRQAIDFLLDDNMQCDDDTNNNISAMDCCKFIRECGYFFLATSQEEIERREIFLNLLSGK